MFSAGAYSFRQMARLAISLSWIGGYTNVIALLALGTVVSHVTGATTQLGHWIAQRDLHQAKFFGFLLLTFVSGAGLSAFLTETAKRRGWRSKFILPIGIEALLLAALMSLLSSRGFEPIGMRLILAAGLASLAMGLQNATITRISGSVVRTTHLTGIFTDLGLESVQYLFWVGDELAKKRKGRARRLLRASRRHPPALRLLLLLSIAGSFGFGTVVGTIAFSHWSALSLLAPIVFLLWIVYVDWHTPIADIRELDLLNDPELHLDDIVGKLLPPEVTLYRSTCGQRRLLEGHRAPDFQRWLDRVPETCRVVVLAVSALTRFDSNAVLDLKVAVKRLQDSHRQLVLAGITIVQFKALDAQGVVQKMDVSNVCPDLEFAIARAIGIVQEMNERAGHCAQGSQARVR